MENKTKRMLGLGLIAWSMMDRQTDDPQNPDDQNGTDQPTDTGPASPQTPPTTGEWSLEYNADFQDGLGPFEVGYGWGNVDSNSWGRIDPEEVTLRDGQLVLTNSHSGTQESVRSPAVNTKGTAEFGPGSYSEARIKMPHRDGWLPAFWSKVSRDPPAWPPEIDFVEILGSPPNISQSSHHIHYTTDGSVGGPWSSYCNGCYNNLDTPADETFYTYGCHWEQDRVDFYVDGVRVHRVTNNEVMRSLNNGAPFYSMLNIHVGKIGTPDLSESWDDEMVVDWARLWKRP